MEGLGREDQDHAQAYAQAQAQRYTPERESEGMLEDAHYGMPFMV